MDFNSALKTCTALINRPAMTWLVVLTGVIACIGRPVSASCTGVRIVMTPPRVVVKYGGSFNVICSTSEAQVEGMGWESSLGAVSLTDNVTSLPFKITALTQWTFSPRCYINLLNGDQCQQKLSVTAYKMPDNVTISPSSHLGPMVEGKKYSLQCDINNVAPVKNLSVIWQKRNETIYSQSYDREVDTLVNESSVLTITPSRDDNGAQIHCAAQLNLGPMGPNPAVMASKPHEMIVHFPPTFMGPETENLQLTSKSKNILNCTATGNPKPVYSWQSPHPLQVDTKNKAVLTPPMLIPGTYNCTASNAVANRTKTFIVSEVQGGLTTFAAIIGAVVVVGAILAVVLGMLVTSEGTFSTTKGSWFAGRTSSSGII